MRGNERPTVAQWKEEDVTFLFTSAVRSPWGHDTHNTDTSHHSSCSRHVPLTDVRRTSLFYALSTSLERKRLFCLPVERAKSPRTRRVNTHKHELLRSMCACRTHSARDVQPRGGCFQVTAQEILHTKPRPLPYTGPRIQSHVVMLRFWWYQASCLFIHYCSVRKFYI